MEQYATLVLVHEASLLRQALLSTVAGLPGMRLVGVRVSNDHLFLRYAAR